MVSLSQELNANEVLRRTSSFLLLPSIVNMDSDTVQIRKDPWLEMIM